MAKVKPPKTQAASKAMLIPIACSPCHVADKCEVRGCSLGSSNAGCGGCCYTTCMPSCTAYVSSLLTGEGTLFQRAGYSHMQYTNWACMYVGGIATSMLLSSEHPSTSHCETELETATSANLFCFVQQQNLITRTEEICRRAFSSTVSQCEVRGCSLDSSIYTVLLCHLHAQLYCSM